MRKGGPFMKAAFKILLFLCFLPVSAFANDTILEFSFRTVEGDTIEYRAANRSLMVINIGAHW
jgi:hypothetical protein